MSAQGLIVGLIVVVCCGYAAWTLMPGVARRWLAKALMKLPLPAPLRQRLVRAARPASGCGCDGCDRSELVAKPAPAAPRQAGKQADKQVVMTFHRRTRR